MISRRHFIAGTAAVLAARLAGAQDKPGREVRVGILDVVAEPVNQANLEQLRKGLKELGYEEGKNLRIEYRSGDGRSERYPALAAELARLKVDVIVTNGTPATMAAKSVTAAIPVVIANALDPVDTGLVASLEKPGGRVTGIAVMTDELETKRVELLRALAPGRKRVAVLVNLKNPGLAESWKQIQAAAKNIGLEPMLVNVTRPEKIQKAFDTAAAKKAEALVVRVGVLAEPDRRRVVDLAARHKLPAIYAQRQFVDDGGLASYGLSLPDMYYRAATYVDKILKGANPGELAMERPARYEFVVNRKTLRALDLVIPPDLLLRSNDVVG